MLELQIRCEVSLWEPIVLATQDKTDYQPLNWALKNGNRVIVRMNVDEAAAKEHYAEHSSTPNYFVNTPVRKVFLSLTVANVSDLDLSRLLGTNTSEETHHAHFETATGSLDIDYQSADELGLRIVKDILEAANALVRFIRINYGQHWLEPLTQQLPDPQTFLESVRAHWLNENVWTPLVVNPHVASITGLVIGGTRQYLEIADWESIQGALTRGDLPSDPFSLASDAKERFEENDGHIAVLHLNSAMEAAVDEFIRVQLGPKIPAPSLKNVLKENYDRLLNNWVLPLSDELNLDLRNIEWPSIKKIQELRREAGHPLVTTGIATIGEREWLGLVKHVVSAISKLTGIPVPKSPHPMSGEMHSGTD